MCVKVAPLPSAPLSTPIPVTVTVCVAPSRLRQRISWPAATCAMAGVKAKPSMSTSTRSSGVGAGVALGAALGDTDGLGVADAAAEADGLGVADAAAEAEGLGVADVGLGTADAVGPGAVEAPADRAGDPDGLSRPGLADAPEAGSTDDALVGEAAVAAGELGAPPGLPLEGDPAQPAMTSISSTDAAGCVRRIVNVLRAGGAPWRWTAHVSSTT